MGKFLEEYYKNDAKKLHQIVDKIVRKFGGISDKDMDDFYSLANEVFTTTLRDFDETKCTFEGFLYSNLVRKINTEIRDRNRGKRSNTKIKLDKHGNVITDQNGKIVYEFVPDVSMDMPLNEEDETSFGETISSKSNVEQEIIEKKREEYSDSMMKYLSRLSEVQKQVLQLISIGYIASEIISELHISNKEYSNAVAAIHSVRNISVLL